MKKMKKMMALALAMVMVLAMSVTVFADAPTNGSITVNPNNKGQTYTLYKLFDAHITFKEKEGTNPVEYEQAAITYTLPSGKSLGTTGEQWFVINDNGFVEAKDTLTDAVMKSNEFITWAKSIGTQQGSAIAAADDNDPNVKWEEVPFGYYFVDSTLGAFIGIDSDNPDVTIQDKNNPPKLDKKIKQVNDASGEADGSVFDATETDEIQFDGDGSNEHAIAQVGDTITYTIEVTAKPGAENYVVTDTLDAGLTPPAATGVTVKAGNTDLKAQETKSGTKDATVAVSGQVITVTFSNDYLNTLTADTVLTIEYTATLNGSAVVASSSNDNTAKLEWGHKPTKDYTEDESKVWAAKVGVDKRVGESSGDPLKGATFVLKKGDLFYKNTNGVVTWVTEQSQATTHTTGEDGKLDADFTGLANGTYTLVETVVPDGYNKTDDTTITIEDADVTTENLAQTAVVMQKNERKLI